uniref:Eukaryotic translation initiation factor 3 subunit L n=1 Tax=Ditylenchus dipsaci TaxID=166011 RepID=A0A915E2P9_9BILA
MAYSAYSRSAHTGDPERDLAFEREGNVGRVDLPEEHGFADLTDRFFSEKPWPNEAVVERVVGSDNRLFIVLYKELYFRDLYTRMSRGGAVCRDSQQANNLPVSIQLPNLWLWDIIDEFVYQFQAFCLYKANPAKRKPEEDEYLGEIEQSQNAWNIYPINDQLKAIREGGNPDDVADEFGRNPLYFGLGYFSLIGLLRTHVLLGDYHQALQTVNFLEMDTKGLYNNVPSCLVTLHYFVGFSHLMMRNYAEATKIFINCLLYIQRTQNIQQQQSQQKKNTKYDVIGKNEQLFHLLAICLTLQPQRIDESIQSQLAEKSGDRMLRMANGDIEEFRNAFQQGCPKFLSPTTVAYCNGHNLAKESLNRQCNAFLEGIESQICLPILRGYLKLYTTLPLKKLASFMKVPESDLDSFVGKLLTFKMIVNELGKETIERDIDDSTTDLDFYVDRDMINIADTKVARRIGEYFISTLHKVERDSKQSE